jgi:ElaB/YqjD/DUF883 family membrane-anchored ribosome-binding protein
VDNELEVIRHQMEETRSSLADKLGELEGQIRGAVEGATNLVTDTAETVQETIHNVTETVQDTVHTVAEAFDLSKQVERHPWPMMGAAVATGFAGSLVLSRLGGVTEVASSAASSLNGATSRVAAAVERPGPIRDVLTRVKGLAIGALMGAVGDMVVKALPSQYAEDATKIVDDLTVQLGGKPREHKPQAASPEACPPGTNMGRNI